MLGDSLVATTSASAICRVSVATGGAAAPPPVRGVRAGRRNRAGRAPTRAAVPPRPARAAGGGTGSRRRGRPTGTGRSKTSVRQRGVPSAGGEQARPCCSRASSASYGRGRRCHAAAARPYPAAARLTRRWPPGRIARHSASAARGAGASRPPSARANAPPASPPRPAGRRPPAPAPVPAPTSASAASPVPVTSAGPGLGQPQRLRHVPGGQPQPRQRGGGSQGVSNALAGLSSAPPRSRRWRVSAAPVAASEQPAISRPPPAAPPDAPCPVRRAPAPGRPAPPSRPVNQSRWASATGAAQHPAELVRLGELQARVRCWRARRSGPRPCRSAGVHVPP